MRRISLRFHLDHQKKRGKKSFEKRREAENNKKKIKLNKGKVTQKERHIEEKS